MADVQAQHNEQTFQLNMIAKQLYYAWFLSWKLCAHQNPFAKDSPTTETGAANKHAHDCCRKIQKQLAFLFFLKKFSLIEYKFTLIKFIDVYSIVQKIYV